MNLRDTTAIITGSTGRIGSAIALALAEAGCDCLCHWHSNEKAADELIERLRATGRRAQALRADIGDPAQVSEMFEKAARHIAAGRLNPLAVLVNSAAAFLRQPLAQLDPAQTHRLLAVNFLGPVVACREFARLLSQRQSPGKIVNLIDVGAQRPWSGYVGYCGSKAALAAATKTLAKELAPGGITVNGVAPGVVTWPEDAGEESRNRQLRMIPLHRFGEPDEIASAVMFLLENDYVTGQIVNVDGGRSI